MGIASDPTSRFLYVTDAFQNQLLAYGIQSTGALTAVNSGPFSTGTYPVGVTVDPRGEYIYVTNYQSSGTISEYSINQATGAPSASASSSISSDGPGPICIIVEPALARFVFTPNFLSSTVGGKKLDPNTGALSTNQNSPYPTAGQPTCVAAVPHGNHSTQNTSSTAGG
jgi:DNA-binding beta-propeller fold protein YncE